MDYPNTFDFDVLVVGAGHAGCEAALAAARMGCKTLLTTIALESVAQMSCNPAIGGTAKGILVREVDALGGAQGLITDRSGIQFRMLNRSRGPAVQSPRAQCDKRTYALLMKQLIEQTPNLTLRQEMVDELLVIDDSPDKQAAKQYQDRLKQLREGVAPSELKTPAPAAGTLRVIGIRAGSGITYTAKCVILTTGTFLRGLIHQGTKTSRGGRAGEQAAMSLSGSLEALGFELRRLKTGTPPRLNGRSINFTNLEAQWGEDPEPAFSYRTEKIDRPRMACWITRTSARTHEIIRENLHRAPLYTGQIQSQGPRYCPSVEDKVVKFGEKESHQIFLEPEGTQTEEYYVNGLSTSLPPEVQVEMVKSVPGCEAASILRFGYAIEYDMVPPHQIDRTLATRRAKGLYLAGQINGTSGYEEAAGQGILAGINAGLFALTQGKETFTLGRDEAYLGILIDDLVTKEIGEPYRLFTSRSEYRLLLRQDNADRRLYAHAKRLGLLDQPSQQRSESKQAQIADLSGYLKNRKGPNSPKKYWDLLREPEMDWEKLKTEHHFAFDKPYASEVIETVQIEAKYAGYLRRQLDQVERLKDMEQRSIPEKIDYSKINSLSREAKEKLAKHRPATFGQALRIDGVTPADLGVITLHLHQTGMGVES